MATRAPGSKESTVVFTSGEALQFQVADSDVSQVHSDGGQLPGPHLESEVALAKKERLLLTHPERLENKSSKD